MTLKVYLKKLEKRKIISRKPHPLVPFVLALIIYILAVISTNIIQELSKSLYYLAIFSLIFAIIHLILAYLLWFRGSSVQAATS